MKSTISYHLVLFLVSSEAFLTTTAFLTPGSQQAVQLISKSLSRTRNEDRIIHHHHHHQIGNLLQCPQVKSGTTSLQMGYNLPPGGGGSGGGGGGEVQDKISEFLTPIATIAALVLFFVSPLGGIFFAITNSLFILALVTPVLIGVGFTTWKYFNTIEGVCPSCGAPASVLKNEDAGPNICLSCGQLIRATVNKDGIELCNNPDDIFDEKSRVSSIFDIFTSDRSVYEDTMISTTAVVDDGDVKKKKDQTRRERTVIDVDVEKE